MYRKRQKICRKKLKKLESKVLKNGARKRLEIREEKIINLKRRGRGMA